MKLTIALLLIGMIAFTGCSNPCMETVYIVDDDGQEVVCHQRNWNSGVTSLSRCENGYTYPNVQKFRFAKACEVTKDENIHS